MSSNNNDSSQKPDPVDGSGGDESRLSRWSRRKLQSEREQTSPADAVGADENDIPGNELIVEESQRPSAATQSGEAAKDVNGENVTEEVLERELTDADMPDIDSLTPDSDFKPFMSKGISHALRRKALRKLFASPFFKVRDGLDDYDDDFTSFAPLGDTVTADMKYAQEYKEKLRLEAEQEQQEKLRAQREQQLLDGESDEGESPEPDHELADESNESEQSATESGQIDQDESSTDSTDGQSSVAVTERSDSQASIDPQSAQTLRQQPRKNIRGGSSVDDVDEFDEDV